MLHSKVLVKGLGIEKKRLQHNIVYLTSSNIDPAAPCTSESSILRKFLIFVSVNERQNSYL